MGARISIRKAGSNAFEHSNHFSSNQVTLRPLCRPVILLECLLKVYALAAKMIWFNVDI